MDLRRVHRIRVTGQGSHGNIIVQEIFALSLFGSILITANVLQWYTVTTGNSSNVVKKRRFPVLPFGGLLELLRFRSFRQSLRIREVFLVRLVAPDEVTNLVDWEWRHLWFMTKT